MKPSKKNDEDITKYILTAVIVIIFFTVFLISYAIYRSKHIFPSLEDDVVIEETVKYK